MAYVDYSAAFAYKDLLTYQKLNQLGANDAYFKAAVGGLLDVALGAANSKIFVNEAGTAPVFASGMAIGTLTRDTAAATGSVATTLGWRPSHVIFLVMVPSTSEVSIGFSDGTNNYCIFNAYSIVAGTWGNDTGDCIHLRQTDAIKYEADMSLDSTGFTLNWTKTDAKTGTATIFYLAFR